MQSRIFFLLTITLGISCFAIPAVNSQPTDILTSTGYPDLDRYNKQYSINSSDYLNERMNYLMETTPIDSFVTNFIDRGFDVACDTVSIFTYLVINTFPRNKLREIYPKLEETAKQYNDKKLMLLIEYIRIWIIAGIESTYQERVDGYERLLRQCQKAGYDELEAFTLYELFYDSYYSSKLAASFAYAKRLIAALDKVDDNYPYKGRGYIMVGTAYYRFKDNERALHYIRKGLSYRNDRNFLLNLWYNHQAWNHLAVYYERHNNPDSAEYYHRTILESAEAVSGERAFLNIAICNLARVEMSRGNYDLAIAYFQPAIINLNKEPYLNWDFTHGVYISLGECMLKKGNLIAAKDYIDKARPGLEIFPEVTQANRLKGLFILKSKYYSQVGRPDIAALCIDSVHYFTERYEQLTGQHIILLGEQQLQLAELNLNKVRMERQKNLLLSVLGILIIISIAIFVILRLYYKKDAAYKALAKRANEWAREKVSLVTEKKKSTVGTDREPFLQKDLDILARVQEEMELRHSYREVGITIESLAERVDVHRNVLSRVINQTTGKNFSQFINSYRIKEAIQIISETDHQKLYIDELYERVGFNNRTSFYRTFKQFTGLSPAEFQKKTD